MAFSTREEGWAYAKGRRDERQAGRIRPCMGVNSSGPMLGPSPVNPNPQQQTNARFRSFAERYLVTRSEFFRTDPEGLAEDQWKCILDAKSAYLKIRQVGIGVED